ncbi:VIN3-like protein 2 [Silene latifolia]|uniref:VIN3-like protein 2 n=1 Tax=Silene latifolia TaxID=37657 RepID=UPI003D76AEBD
MDSSFQGSMLDPVKCSKLTMEGRREIVYELAKWSHGAAEMLQTWSRQDILQILCAEMGKERKYTGLTKLKIIEHLLKVVSEKTSGDHRESVVSEEPSSPSVFQKSSKRPRKPENPSRLLESPSATNISSCNADSDLGSATYCKNAACKAKLNNDVFCKRCTCCVCHNYDDNKDPSIWLTCSSEPPFPGDSCNMTCHLECALKHERSGIARHGLVAQLDGSFYCISCGKMNDLMRCWRKQLMVAKETRRVDILCYRISLSKKLLSGTRKYRQLSEMVEDAVRLLEAEVGTLSNGPVKMGRGIVNRLSSGQQVQRLCSSAVDSFDLIWDTPSYQDSKTIPPSMIKAEAINSTSITLVFGPESPTSENNVGYTLWHRRADVKKETSQPTCTLFPPQTRFIVAGLSPATEYIFRAVPFNDKQELSSCEIRLTTSVSSGNGEIHSPATNWSSLSNRSSVEDETNNITACCDLNANKTEDYFNYYNTNNKIVDLNSSSEPVNSTNVSRDQNPSSGSDEELPGGKFVSVGQSVGVKIEAQLPSDCQIGKAINPGQMLLPCEAPANLPVTPSRKESLKDGIPKNAGSKFPSKANDNCLEKEDLTRSSSKKRRSLTLDEKCPNGPSESNLEYYIKVMSRLECEGHIDKSFRQKFLTWYSIRATPRETRIVKAFVDTLIEDPASLSEQLVDTFGELVSSKRSSDVPQGFCLKLWH